MPTILTRRILRDGLVLAAVFTLFVLGSFLIEPALWLQDYPPDVIAAVQPPPEVSQALRIAVAVIGGLGLGFLFVRSALGYRQDVPERRYLGVLLHVFLLFLLVNVWDLVVLDWLFFVTIQPDLVVFPGTEGLAGYRDYWFHFRASFLHPTPWIAGVVLSLGAGTIAWWLGRRM